jgi:hypothetical protein
MIDWGRLVNLQKYTPLEMFLFGVGCYLWVLVYFIYVKEIRRKGFIEMPAFAACGNIGWEFVWGFLAVTDMGPLLQWCYRIWFFFDLFIFASVLRDGGRQVMTPAIRKSFRPLAIFTAFAWGTSFFTMIRSGLDTPIGANSAYILNLAIAVLYIFLLLQQTDPYRFSMPVAWLKMIGTGMNTVFMNIHAEYAHNYFLRFIAILTTTLDCVYIYLLWRARSESRAAASSRSAVPNPSSKPA